jgi:ubiquinone/menaquinone biosynthesis C-methylase UbiE
MFGHAGRRLVELAGVLSGQRVVDLAAGRGAVLFPAAEHVGPTGGVDGIDIAPGMVEHTQAEIARRGLAHAHMRLLDAERLARLGEAAFEHVLCSFAIFWFPDPGMVLRQARQVLVAGGRIGCAFSRGTDPRWTWYEELLASYGALDGLPALPGRRSIREPGALVAALRSAGFEDIQELVEDTELYFRDADEWWASLWTHGSIRPLERVAPDRLEQFRAECLTHAGPMRQERGLPTSYQFVYVLGNKPRCPR